MAISSKSPGRAVGGLFCDPESDDDADSAGISNNLENKNKPKLFPIFQKNFRPKEEDSLLKTVQLEVEKASTQRKRKRTLLTKEKNGMMQMVLDAGQKQIGPKFCEECGLLYSPGDFEDEEEHRKAHVRIQNTFQLTLWKDVRILFNYPDGCQIIMVLTDVDASRVKNRLKDFLAWLDSELGAGYDPSRINRAERIFLYTTRTGRKNVVRILGCGIMELPDASKIVFSRLVNERLSSSFLSQHSVDSQNSTATTTTTSTSSPKNDNIDNEYEYEHQSNKVVIGITRLWTDSGFRRRNIASNICEMMRFNSGIPSFVVPKENIGILEPSDSGKGFIAKYTNCQGSAYTYK